MVCGIPSSPRLGNTIRGYRRRVFTPRPADLLAVLAGGFIGTAARQVVLLLGPAVGLAVANLLGCALLGILDAILGARRQRLRCFLVVGGIGAFTSWSSLAVQGLSVTCLTVLVFEVPAGVGAAWLGRRLGTRLVRRGRTRT